MDAIKNIMDTLTACGCKPAATVDKNGDTIIKVNAPAIVSIPTLFDSDAAEYEYITEVKKQ